jgi:hypothetical protein
MVPVEKSGRATISPIETAGGVTIEPIEGEPTRYYVGSRRANVAPYLVDVTEYKKNGQCTCEDFQFRKKPHLDRGAKPSPELRCYHIKCVRAWLLNRLLTALEAVHKHNENDNETKKTHQPN